MSNPEVIIDVGNFDSFSEGMFSGAVSETRLARMGKIYAGKPLKTRTRAELVATLRPKDRQHFRADNGDLPEDFTPMPPPGVSRSLPLAAG